MRILIIEEDAPVANMVKICLNREHYRVDIAEDYCQAVKALSAADYDCVLLEPAIEGGTGIGILQMLRSPGRQPAVITMSSEYTPDRLPDPVEDHVRKPFDPAEIPARIRSVMRRRWNCGIVRPSFGNVELQTDRYGAWVDDREITLKRKEYQLLEFLLGQPQKLVGKTDLTDNVWNGKKPNDSKYDFLYMQVKNLRDKLERAGADIEIVSVYGSGYKLVRKGPGK